MIRGPSPRRSLELIHSFGLYEIVFSPPQNIHEGTLKSTEMAVQAVRLAEWYRLSAAFMSHVNVTYTGHCILI